MARIVENWSEVEGRVVAWHEASDVPGFGLLELAVERVAPVAGFRHLLAGAEGASLRVHVPSGLGRARGLAGARRVVCRVRRATPTMSFVDPGRLVVG